MEVGELVKQNAKKKLLEKQRDSLIKNEVRKRQREKVNMDQSSVKKGYIEKHRIIAKKQFQVVVEKARKIAVEVQDNANPNTYLSRNTNFTKILARTQKRILFDAPAMRDALSAVNSYGISKKEMVINFTLHFEHEIECEPKPCVM